MSEHRYPLPVLIGDYIRAIIGTILCGLPALMIPPHPIATSLLAFLTIVFIVYGVRTGLRQATSITSDQDGLRIDGVKHVVNPWILPWSEVTSLRLAFFPTRRRKGEGVMELTLQSGNRRLKLDSNIGGFLDIANRAYHEALSRKFDLAQATMRNFQILDISGASPAHGESWGRPDKWLDQSQ